MKVNAVSNKPMMATNKVSKKKAPNKAATQPLKAKPAKSKLNVQA